MKKFATFIAILFFVPLFTLAQGQSDTGPSAGITPDSPLYFLDRFGETLGDFFAFTAKAKVRAQTAHAAERLAEIEAMLEEKGVTEVRGLMVAQERIQGHFAKAVNVIEERKGRGLDVSALAAMAVDGFHKQRLEALETFRNALDDFLNQKETLIEELRLAVQAGNIDEAERIRAELSEIEAQKEAAEQLKDETLKALDAEKGRLHDDLDEDKEAEVEGRDRALEKLQQAEERRRAAQEQAQEMQRIAQERVILEEEKQEEELELSNEELFEQEDPASIRREEAQQRELERARGRQ